VVNTIFESIPVFLTVCLVLSIAQGVYVLFGFGAGLIAVGALALVLPDIQDVVVLLLLVNLPAELFVVLRNWQAIAWRGVLLICIGVAVGIPLGTKLLSSGDPILVLSLLGISLILTGLIFCMMSKPNNITWPGWTAPPLGLLSGTLSGLFGTGGPPLVVYYQLAGVSRTVFRGNLMAIFLLKTMVRVPAYAASDLITLQRLWSGLAVLPAVLIGAWVGHKIHLQITERTFRRMISVVLVLIGILLILRTTWFQG
jgi:uncharacterized membrane protein YfcA